MSTPTDRSRWNSSGLAVGQRAAPQTMALTLGSIYAVAGIAGFFVTGFAHFAEQTGKSLIGFEVNPLHNLVHLVIGLLAIGAAARLGWSRAVGWFLFAAFGAAFFWGLFDANTHHGNYLSLNDADNVLHAISALAGLAIALWPASRYAGFSPLKNARET